MAVQRGPVVYALESHDLPEGVMLEQAALRRGTELSPVHAEIAGHRVIALDTKASTMHWRRTICGKSRSGWSTYWRIRRPPMPVTTSRLSQPSTVVGTSAADDEPDPPSADAESAATNNSDETVVDAEFEEVDADDDKKSKS